MRARRVARGDAVLAVRDIVADDPNTPLVSLTWPRVRDRLWSRLDQPARTTAERYQRDMEAVDVMRDVILWGHARGIAQTDKSQRRCEEYRILRQLDPQEGLPYFVTLSDKGAAERVCEQWSLEVPVPTQTAVRLEMPKLRAEVIGAARDFPIDGAELCGTRVIPRRSGPALRSAPVQDAARFVDELSPVMAQYPVYLEWSLRELVFVLFGSSVQPWDEKGCLQQPLLDFLIERAACFEERALIFAEVHRETLGSNWKAIAAAQNQIFRLALYLVLRPDDVDSAQVRNELRFQHEQLCWLLRPDT